MNNVTEKEAADFKSKLLHTLFNPFAGNKQTLSMSGTSPMGKALTHGAGLALGYGGLAMLVSKLKKKLDEGKAKENRDESLDSYVQARNLDIPFGKAASGRHWAHPVIAMLAAAGGLYGGTRLASKSDAAVKTEGLDAEIADTERQIAELIKQEYNRTRGIEEPVEKVAFMDTAKGMYGIYAAAALALAYAKAHDYVANSGEDAKKLKALKELAKRKKMLTEEPITINPMNFGQSNNTLPAVAEKKDMSSVDVTPTDPNDPYGSVLG
jgi:hypothetical protein